MAALTMLAEQAGIKAYKTVLPTDFVVHCMDYYEKLTGRREYPNGFVWSYDDSPLVGEPIPLTAEARAYARIVLINPRNPKFMEEL